MKNKFILFPILTFLLSSCSSDEIIFPENNNISILNNNEPLTYGKTEWGNFVKELPKVTKTKKLTLLSYLAFDNDKQSDRYELSPVINNHEEGGSSDLFNQILLTDGDETGDIKKYYIISDNNNNEISSPYIQLKNEKNTSNSKTLSSFIKWGFSSYPSKIKILDVNSHGMGYDGITIDKTSKSTISIPEFANSIKNTIKKVDVVSFNACLMSTLEVDYELINLVDYVVASQDRTLSTGLLYAKYLPEIISKSNTSSDIAKNILDKSDRFGRTLSEFGEDGKKIPNVFTLSVIKISEIERLSFYINKLSKYILNKPKNYSQIFKMSLNKTNQASVDKLGKDSGQRDLHEIMGRFENEINNSSDLVIKNDSELKDIVKNIQESIERSILARSIQRQTDRWAEGLAININKDNIQSKKYQETLFAKNNLWDEMIIKINLSS